MSWYQCILSLDQHGIIQRPYWFENITCRNLVAEEMTHLQGCMGNELLCED